MFPHNNGPDLLSETTRSRVTSAADLEAASNATSLVSDLIEQARGSLNRVTGPLLSVVNDRISDALRELQGTMRELADAQAKAQETMGALSAAFQPAGGKLSSFEDFVAEGLRHPLNDGLRQAKRSGRTIWQLTTGPDDLIDLCEQFSGPHEGTALDIVSTAMEKYRSGPNFAKTPIWGTFNNTVTQFAEAIGTLPTDSQITEMFASFPKTSFASKDLFSHCATSRKALCDFAQEWQKLSHATESRIYTPDAYTDGDDTTMETSADMITKNFLIMSDSVAAIAKMSIANDLVLPAPSLS